MEQIKRRRLGRDRWVELLERCGASGLSVEAFCRQEGISPKSFYRWRRVLRHESTSPSVTRSMARPAATPFVDLGALVGRQAGASPFELKLDLGGGLMLHLVRG